MARNKKQPITGTGDNMDELPGDAVIQDETTILDNGREDSDGGDREEVTYEVVPEAALEQFPVSLVNPGGDIFKPYGEAVEAFMKEVIALPDKHINWLTVTLMTVPSVDAPEVLITPYCGFPVIKGDTFSARLSNGMLITA